MDIELLGYCTRFWPTLIKGLSQLANYYDTTQPPAYDFTQSPDKLYTECSSSPGECPWSVGVDVGMFLVARLSELVGCSLRVEAPEKQTKVLVLLRFEPLM